MLKPNDARARTLYNIFRYPLETWCRWFQTRTFDLVCGLHAIESSQNAQGNEDTNSQAGALGKSADGWLRSNTSSFGVSSRSASGIDDSKASAPSSRSRDGDGRPNTVKGNPNSQCDISLVHRKENTPFSQSSSLTSVYVRSHQWPYPIYSGAQLQENLAAELTASLQHWSSVSVNDSDYIKFLPAQQEPSPSPSTSPSTSTSTSASTLLGASHTHIRNVDTAGDVVMVSSSTDHGPKYSRVDSEGDDGSNDNGNGSGDGGNGGSDHETHADMKYVWCVDKQGIIAYSILANHSSHGNHPSNTANDRAQRNTHTHTLARVRSPQRETQSGFCLVRVAWHNFYLTSITLAFFGVSATVMTNTRKELQEFLSAITIPDPRLSPYRPHTGMHGGHDETGEHHSSYNSSYNSSRKYNHNRISKEYRSDDASSANDGSVGERDSSSFYGISKRTTGYHLNDATNDGHRRRASSVRAQKGDGSVGGSGNSKSGRVTGVSVDINMHMDIGSESATNDIERMHVHPALRNPGINSGNRGTCADSHGIGKGHVLNTVHSIAHSTDTTEINYGHGDDASQSRLDHGGNMRHRLHVFPFMCMKTRVLPTLLTLPLASHAREEKTPSPPSSASSSSSAPLLSSSVSLPSLVSSSDMGRSTALSRNFLRHYMWNKAWRWKFLNKRTLNLTLRAIR